MFNHCLEHWVSFVFNHWNTGHVICIQSLLLEQPISFWNIGPVHLCSDIKLLEHCIHVIHVQSLSFWNTGPVHLCSIIKSFKNTWCVHLGSTVKLKDTWHVHLHSIVKL